DDVLSNEPVMPEILIKPNKSIPTIIGICLILGSLLVGVTALSNLTAGTISSEEATALADSLNLQGANLTGSEVTDYFAELQDDGYYTTLGIIESLATIVLLSGGVLMILGKRLGVWIGAGGAGLMIVDAMVGMTILAGVESPDPLLSLTMKFLSAFFIGCGLFCLALPFVPLLVASGRAALEPMSKSIVDEEE
ncbi:MAG TPA: hypothetical protein QF621_06185, partial [Candidatus Thalassarchaeaceae archaeon]|nr:hypothetical protein [Candidatus Thalassarchaeaceae archaeon]